MYRAFRPSPANVTSRAGTAVMTDPFYCVGWMNLLVFKSECRTLLCKNQYKKDVVRIESFVKLATERRPFLY